MSVLKERKAELIKEFGESDSNTGSAAVQIALFTERIKELTEHLKVHRKDFSSRRGLLKLVAKRDKLMKYVRRKAPEKSVELKSRLGIRK